AGQYCKWIKALQDQGIATPCDGANNFCPTDPVSRGALAVWLWKTVHVGDPTPTPCTKDSFEGPQARSSLPLRARGCGRPGAALRPAGKRLLPLCPGAAGSA